MKHERKWAKAPGHPKDCPCDWCSGDIDPQSATAPPELRDWFWQAVRRGCTDPDLG
jgi:hypothetical protein